MFMIRFILILILIAFLVPVLPVVSHAADREQELFTAAYEHLFSFQPELAAEGFRTFLKEYPQSSVKDAALFWLGKTLIHLRSMDEARQIFAQIRREFPESPFLSHIQEAEEEMAKLKEAPASAPKSQPPPAAAGAAQQAPPPDSVSRLEAALTDEKKKVAQLTAKVSELEAREETQRTALRELEQSRMKDDVLAQQNRELKIERDRLASDLSTAREQLSRTSDALNEKAAAADSSARSRIADLQKQVSEQTAMLSGLHTDKADLSSRLDTERARAAALSDQISQFARIEDTSRSQIRDLQDQIQKANADIELLRKTKDGESTEALQKRILVLEGQLRTRESDLRILNSYLTHLMFKQRQAQTEATAKAPASQPAASEPQTQPASRAFMIGGKSLTLKEIVDSISSSSATLKKLGITDLPWRGKSPYDDFLAELLLLQDAERSIASFNTQKGDALSKQHKLSRQETEYLQTLLLISAYVDLHARKIVKNQAIDMLSFEYKASKSSDKASLPAELQSLARQGISFEDIQKKYPDNIRYIRMTQDAFLKTYKEKSAVLQKLNTLQENSVGLFSEDGFMLLKIAKIPLTFDPFVTQSPSDKALLKKLADDLLIRLNNRPSSSS